MRRLLLAGAALSLLAVSAPPARSQLTSVAIAGGTCPSDTQYPVGNNRPLILTQTGVLCTSGSGGGGGGGGAITIASGAAVDGWSVTGGSTTDVVCATDTGTCTDIAFLKRMNVSLSAMVAAIGSPIPAGTNVIGHVIVDSSALPTGAATQTTLASVLSAVTGSIPAGSALIGHVIVDSTGLPTGASTAAKQPALGTAGSASTDVITVQGIASGTPVPASISASTTGGATEYGLQSAASTNSTSVKGSAGTLLGLNLLNTTTTIYYLRMYNTASAPTCSSATNFVRTWPVPPAAAAGGAGGIAVHLPVMGTVYSTGIAFCLTGGPTSTDNTNAATGVFVNIDYK